MSVRDSVEDYTQLMKEIFDLELLKKLISGENGRPPFTFVANANLQLPTSKTLYIFFNVICVMQIMSAI